jgi:hypothetical protein
MKIINLIITNSSGNLYPALMRQWRRYMNLNSNIKSFFIEMKSELNVDHIITDDSIILKGNESYVPGIYEKTLRAIKICLELPEFNHVNYFIRTNISSFWIWDRLLKFIESLPTENYAGSGLVMENRDRLWNSPHGSNMILTRDVVKILINNYNHEYRKEADDIAIGGILNLYSIKVNKYPWYVISDHISQDISGDIIKTISKIPDNVFTIRNNLSITDIRHSFEVYTYETLVNTFY